MSSRRLQDMSSKHLSDMSSRRFQDMSSRRLQDVFSITIFRLPRHLQGALQYVFKTSSRRLGRHKIVTVKTCWRRLQDMSCGRLQDVFKTIKCLPGKNRLNRLDIWVIYFLFIYDCLEIWICFLRKAWHLAKSFK